MLKLVFNKTSGVIIGVHIIGTDATEIVHYGASLVKNQTTLAGLISTMFVAVTVSWGSTRAAYQLLVILLFKFE